MRQMAAQVEPGDRHRDPDSENSGARETDQREPAIERNVGAERQTIRAENFQQPNSPCSDDQSEHATDGREQHRLDRNLFHDVPSARAHRSPNPQFFLASPPPDSKENFPNYPPH